MEPKNQKQKNIIQKSWNFWQIFFSLASHTRLGRDADTLRAQVEQIAVKALVATESHVREHAAGISSTAATGPGGVTTKQLPSQPPLFPFVSYEWVE